MDLSRRVRPIALLPDVKLAGMSAWVVLRKTSKDEQIRDQCTRGMKTTCVFEAGFDGSIPKPIPIAFVDEIQTHRDVEE